MTETQVYWWLMLDSFKGDGCGFMNNPSNLSDCCKASTHVELLSEACFRMCECFRMCDRCGQECGLINPEPQDKGE